MSIGFPGETPEYRDARNQLLEDEIALRRQMEKVAAARRALPRGGPIPTDYVLDDGSASGVALSKLFDGKESLAIYSMMFPRDAEDLRPGATMGTTAQLPLEASPCPSCAALLDQLEGAVDHVSPHVAFVVFAKAPIAQLREFANDRGWRRLRLFSVGRTTYSRDYHGENANGTQRPMLNVFSWNGGAIRHSWGSEMLYAPSDPEQDPRHLGTLEPMWNLFDLTREGRHPNWDEQMQYEPCTACQK